jgi:DNA-binding CsgD family transcriptional regulator
VDEEFRTGVGVRLSERQRKIVALLSEGLINCDIANRLGYTEYQVQTSLRQVYELTGHSNRTELALWWVKNNG